MYYVTIYCIDIIITCGCSVINIFLLCCTGITFVLRKLCIRIILVYASLHLISLVCLFVCLFVCPPSSRTDVIVFVVCNQILL